MSIAPVELILPGAASAGVVVGAQIAAAHLRFARVDDYKSSLTVVVENLLARDALTCFVPLRPPGPRWWPLVGGRDLLSGSHRYFTVVLVRHDGRNVRSVLLAWYRSRTADEALRALLPELGLGDLEVKGAHPGDYLPFNLISNSSGWFGFVVPSGHRAFRTATCDVGLAWEG